MKSMVFALSMVVAGSAFAEPPAPAPDQKALLAGTSPQTEANKRLVFDFWREVLEGGHLDKAAQYLDEGYIQHNPNVPTGRAGFVAFFSRFSKPRPVVAVVKAPLVAITAEGDLVVVSSVQTLPVPGKPGQTYSTTWFDMFRVVDGKILEHWDSAQLQ